MFIPLIILASMLNSVGVGYDSTIYHHEVNISNQIVTYQDFATSMCVDNATFEDSLDIQPLYDFNLNYTYNNVVFEDFTLFRIYFESTSSTQYVRFVIPQRNINSITDRNGNYLPFQLDLRVRLRDENGVALTNYYWHEHFMHGTFVNPYVSSKDIVYSVYESTQYVDFYLSFTQIDEDLFNSYNTLIESNDYQTGYDDGYDTGYGVGYDKGNEDGRDIGYQDGYDIGYQFGYGDGRQDTIEQGQVASVIFSGILSIGLLPINCFLMMLNFEVFGINIGALVSSLLTICVIIILVRTLFGGSGSKD